MPVKVVLRLGHVAFNCGSSSSEFSQTVLHVAQLHTDNTCAESFFLSLKVEANHVE